VARMLKERGDIKDAIALADKHKNYGDLMELLKRALNSIVRLWMPLSADSRNW